MGAGEPLRPEDPGREGRLGAVTGRSCGPVPVSSAQHPGFGGDSSALSGCQLCSTGSSWSAGSRLSSTDCPVTSSRRLSTLHLRPWAGPLPLQRGRRPSCQHCAARDHRAPVTLLALPECQVHVEGITTTSGAFFALGPSGGGTGLPSAVGQGPASLWESWDQGQLPELTAPPLPGA